MHANDLPVPTMLFEFDQAGDSGKKGVILTHTHIVSRMNSGSLLPYQYRTRQYLFAGKSLNAQSLTV